MRLLVVGGQSRNLGKTSIICELLRAFADLDWTTVKITPCEPGECPQNREEFGCRSDEHAFDIRVEGDPAGRGDTSRFLAAGAAQAIWVRVKPGHLAKAWLALRPMIADRPHVIIESNSILEFVEPALYLMVLDYRTREFKASARAYLDRTDGFILHDPGGAEPAWEGVSRATLAEKPLFVLSRGRFSTPELLDTVRAKILSAKV